MGADRATGGLIFLVSKSWAPVRSELSLHELCNRCPGRAAALTLCSGDQKVRICQVHNERLGDCAREIADQLRDFRLEINGRFDSLEHRMARLEQESERLKVGLARVEADVAILKADMASVKTRLTTLEEAAQRIEARQERDEAERRAFWTQAEDYRRRLDELESRVQDLEERLPPE